MIAAAGPVGSVIDSSDGLADFLEGLARWTQAQRLWILIRADGAQTLQTWSEDRSFSADQAEAIMGRLTQDLDWADDQIASGPDPAEGLACQGSAPVHTLLLRSSGSAPHIILGLDGTPDLRAKPELPAILKGSLMAISQVLKQARQNPARPPAEVAPEVAPEIAPAREERRNDASLAEGGVAHNFNNIIGAIAGFSATASLYAPPGSPIANNLAEIQVAVRRARALVMEVLDRGRWPESPSAVVDVERLLAETASLLESSLPTNVKLHVGSSRELGLVRGRYAALQQVLMNLCNNAAQAMPQGGRILCLGGRAHLRRPLQLSHTTLEPGRYKTVSICDEGLGISAEALPRLFEPFFTTRSAGTGLGLSTAASIVEEHGGAIDVVSAPGQGSRFTIWLPAEMEGLASAEGLRPGAGEIVLLVAPATERLEADEELLAAMGYEARTSTDLANIAGLRDAIDVALIVDMDAEFAAAAVSALRSGGWSGPILKATPGVADGVPNSVGYPLKPRDLGVALSAVLPVQAALEALGDQAIEPSRWVRAPRRVIRRFDHLRRGKLSLNSRRLGVRAAGIAVSAGVAALCFNIGLHPPLRHVPAANEAARRMHKSLTEPGTSSAALAAAQPPGTNPSLQSASRATIVGRSPRRSPLRAQFGVLAKRSPNLQLNPRRVASAASRAALKIPAPSETSRAPEAQVEMASLVTGVCRAYEGLDWRELGFTSAKDCLARAFAARSVTLVQFGDHLLSRGQAGLVISSYQPAQRALRFNPLLPLSRPSPAPERWTAANVRTASDQVTAMTDAVCRAFDDGRWKEMSYLTPQRCLNEGFKRASVTYLQVGTRLLERRGMQAGVLDGDVWHPRMRNGREVWHPLMQDGHAVTLEAATGGYAGVQSRICRRFDGERWRDLASGSADDCVRRAFAEPGTGSVQSGQWVLTRRADQVGVVEGPSWHAVATLIQPKTKLMRLSLKTTSQGERLGLRSSAP